MLLSAPIYLSDSVTDQTDLSPVRNASEVILCGRVGSHECVMLLSAPIYLNDSITDQTYLNPIRNASEVILCGRVGGGGVTSVMLLSAPIYLNNSITDQTDLSPVRNASDVILCGRVGGHECDVAVNPHLSLWLHHWSDRSQPCQECLRGNIVW